MEKTGKNKEVRSTSFVSSTECFNFLKNTELKKNKASTQTVSKWEIAIFHTDEGCQPKMFVRRSDKDETFKCLLYFYVFNFSSPFTTETLEQYNWTLFQGLAGTLSVKNRTSRLLLWAERVSCPQISHTHTIAVMC